MGMAINQLVDHALVSVSPHDYFEIDLPGISQVKKSLVGWRRTVLP